MLRYQKEIFLALKILVPVFGIIFLNWSIGTVFLYFCFDLLFLGGETVLRIFFAAKSSIGEKIGSFFRFLLAYTVLLIFVMVAMGNFFRGDGPGNMEAHFDQNLIYSLCAVYGIEFLAGYLFSSAFKTATAKSVEKKTYYLVLIVFVMMVCFLLILRALVSSQESNYVLGISIILARQGAEYLLARQQQKADTGATGGTAQAN